MSALTCRQYRTVIDDLLTKRLAALRSFPAGPQHEAALRRLGADLDALVAHENAPADADGLQGLVRTHVDATAALHHALQTEIRTPGADPQDVAAARRVHRKIVAGRLGWGADAGKRFEFATDARDVRASLDAALARFPAAPGRLSLAARVDAWIDLGEEIGRVLGARTNRDADPEVRSAAELCREARARFADLRAAIRMARRLDRTLPANLESRILGLADELTPPRKSAAKSASAPA
jgi:hypothetical protein